MLIRDNLRTLISVALTCIVCGGSLPAYSADLNLGARAELPTIPNKWEGFYWGTDLSIVGEDSHTVLSSVHPSSSTPIGNGSGEHTLDLNFIDVASIGGHIGLLYPLSNDKKGFVLGFETSFIWLDLKKTFTVPEYSSSQTTAVGTYTNTLDWLGLLVGKFGYAIDDVLLFGSAGLSYGRTVVAGQVKDLLSTNSYEGRRSKQALGYAVGGGIEYKIPKDNILNTVNLLANLLETDSLSLKADYIYYVLPPLNRINLSVPGTNTSDFEIVKHSRGHIVRLGFNYVL